ncbi:MAG: arylsulfatase [Candidatus Solibacter usitatus]|nr:arylsulfatase [Candidatus Solibacter usitatus]
MTRRTVLTMSGAAPAVLRQGSPGQKRPNILFLMTDQQRGDCVGAGGNRVIRTPNMDRIAKEGVLFSQAYSSTPTCTPARTALLTGLSPWHHGMLGMTAMAERYPLEKPRALRDAGYYTMTVGKQHFHPMRNGHGYQRMILDEHCPCGNGPQALAAAEKRGPVERSDYESWFWSQAPNLDPHATGLWWNDYPSRPFALPERLHATTWTGDTAVNFLNGWEGPQPFFLKVSFIRPHSPYDPPERFMKMYEDAALPEARAGKWAEKYEPPSSDRTDIWHGKLNPRVIRRSRQGYYGCISQVDMQIGRILEALEKRGRLDETLILFTSDHGDMTGDHNLWRKSYAYEASARIPMLMRWPTGLTGARRGVEMAQPVELRDVLATFLDAAGAEPSQPIDGRSLLSLVRNSGAGWREFIDLEHDVCYSPSNHWNALTDGRWKYIFHAQNGEEQLFRLAGDPHELNDLAGDAGHAGELRRWRQRLMAHFEERGEPFLVNGRLGLRPKAMMNGPNFPRKAG